MYTIPEDFDLNILKDTTIIQVCFSVNTISLFFENIGFISIEGSFSLLHENKRYDYEEVYPVKRDFDILKLLQSLQNVKISM